MNQIAIIGRFVREIELKTVGNNTQVVNNTLAVNRLFKTNGEQTADFIPVTFWGKSAALVSKYCEKGHLVGVTGRLQSRSYENNQGNTVYVVEVVADNVQFLQAKDTKSKPADQDKLEAQKKHQPF